MPAVHHERYSSINFLWEFMFHSKTAQQCHMIDHHLTLKDTRQEGDREADCVWQVGIQPARQRKSNHFGSEIQPPYCSAIALSNVANGNSAHHA